MTTTLTHPRPAALPARQSMSPLDRVLAGPTRLAPLTAAVLAHYTDAEGRPREVLARPGMAAACWSSTATPAPGAIAGWWRTSLPTSRSRTRARVPRLPARSSPAPLPAARSRGSPHGSLLRGVRVAGGGRRAPRSAPVAGGGGAARPPRCSALAGAARHRPVDPGAALVPVAAGAAEAPGLAVSRARPQPESVRDVVGCMDGYEPVRALTVRALEVHRRTPRSRWRCCAASCNASTPVGSCSTGGCAGGRARDAHPGGQPRARSPSAAVGSSATARQLQRRDQLARPPRRLCARGRPTAAPRRGSTATCWR